MLCNVIYILLWSAYFEKNASGLLTIFLLTFRFHCFYYQRQRLNEYVRVLLNRKIVLQVASYKFQIVLCNHYRIRLAEWTEGDIPNNNKTILRKQRIIFDELCTKKKIMRIVCQAGGVCSMHTAHVSCGRKYKKKKRRKKKDQESDMKCETWRLLEMQCDCTMHNGEWYEI